MWCDYSSAPQPQWWFSLPPLGHACVITFHRKLFFHDDVIKWRHFPRYWPFVWGIHRSPANYFHKDTDQRKYQSSASLAFVEGIHRNIFRVTGHVCANSPVTGEFPHKGQWRGALMFSLIWINSSVNNREAGDLRRYRTHYDVTVVRVDTSHIKLWDTITYPCLNVR